MRAAVVGHVEWIEFGRVDHVPAPGEIVHVSESWQEPGGGGAVAAVQLAKLAGESTLYVALGDDEIGHRAKRELEELGVRVEAAFRPEPQRRGYVHVDAAGERTITVIGDRMGPRADDLLPWELLDETDTVYFTAGDAGAAPAGSPRRHPGGLSPRAGDAGRGRGGARRAGGERQGPWRALRARGSRAGPALRGPHRGPGRRGVRDARGRARAAGRPRRCPARSATCTGAGTASPPA